MLESKNMAQLLKLDNTEARLLHGRAWRGHVPVLGSLGLMVGCYRKKKSDDDGDKR